MTLIVDVSHWQPPDVPWGALYADGVRAAIIKLCHGRVVDSGAYKHFQYATSSRVLTAFYHWLTPSEDPAEQARAFISLLPPQWFGRLAVDVEQDGVTDSVLGAFLDEFGHRCSMPIMIYTRKGWWDANIGGAHDYRYRRFDLWAAGGEGYDQHERQPPPAFVMPIPYPWDHAALEQFTGQGRLPGYDLDIDISLSRLSEDEFKAWWTFDYVTLWRLIGGAMPISDADAKTVADGLASIMVTITNLLPLLKPAPPVVTPPTLHTMADRTNQSVINLFNGLFGGLGKLESVLTAAQKATLYGARGALYTGPAVENMALTDAEKAQVYAALGPVAVG